MAIATEPFRTKAPGLAASREHRNSSRRCKAHFHLAWQTAEVYEKHEVFHLAPRRRDAG